MKPPPKRKSPRARCDVGRIYVSYTGKGRDPYDSAATYTPHVVLLIEKNLQQMRTDALIRRGMKLALNRAFGRFVREKAVFAKIGVFMPTGHD